MTISGTTRVFAIIGDPVAQARSPEIFNALFRQRRVDAAMLPLHVRADDLATVLSALHRVGNVDGIVVTVPHKLAASRNLVACSHRVQVAGAANVLRRGPAGWEGELLDGEGFAAGLQHAGFNPEGRRCAIVGAGGAGTAIALALCDRAAHTVSVCDTDPARASTLASRLAGRGTSSVAVAAPDHRSDIVINATPLGMAPDDDLPIALAALAPAAIVADVVMKPPVTRLLREAARRGHPIVEGRHMLDGQTDLMWRFFGLPQPVLG